MRHSPVSLRINESINRRWLLLWLTLLILVSITVQASFASTLHPMDLKDLVTYSRLIVAGKIMVKHSEWSQDKTTIYTFYNFKTDTILMSQTNSDSIIVIATLGGQMDSMAIRVSGVPEFDTGDELLLFLGGNIRGFPTVMGWESGSFRLVPIGSTNEWGVFNYHWQPVIAVGGVSLVVDQNKGVLGEVKVSQRSPASELKTLAPLRAGDCVKLKDFLKTLEIIISESGPKK